MFHHIVVVYFVLLQISYINTIVEINGFPREISIWVITKLFRKDSFLCEDYKWWAI